jgi:hypothetical protein
LWRGVPLRGSDGDELIGNMQGVAFLEIALNMQGIALVDDDVEL